MTGAGGIEGNGMFGYVPAFGGTPYGAKFEGSRTLSDLNHTAPLKRTL